MSMYKVNYWRKGYGIRVWLSFISMQNKFLKEKEPPDSSMIILYANFYNPQVQS